MTHILPVNPCENIRQSIGRLHGYLSDVGCATSTVDVVAGRNYSSVESPPGSNFATEFRVDWFVLRERTDADDAVEVTALVDIVSNSNHPSCQSSGSQPLDDMQKTKISQIISDRRYHEWRNHLTVQFSDVQTVDTFFFTHLQQDFEFIWHMPWTHPLDDLLSLVACHSSNNKTVVPPLVDFRHSFVLRRRLKRRTAASFEQKKPAAAVFERIRFATVTVIFSTNQSVPICFRFKLNSSERKVNTYK